VWLISSLIYVRPLTRFVNLLLESFIKCYNIALFRVNYLGSKRRGLKEALGWHIEAIYAPLARYAMYCSFIVSTLQITPLKLIVYSYFAKVDRI